VIEFIREFCRLCEGQCCRKFPVYQFLVDNKIMTAEFNGVGTPETTIKLAFRKKDYKSLDCLYHEMGGCPEFVKPNACRQYICKKFDNLLLGLPWEQSRETSRVKKATLALYRGMA
jgi:hypothetical protein